MSSKEKLRQTRADTQIHFTSNDQSKRVIKCVKDVMIKIKEKYNIKLKHENSVYLKEITDGLKTTYPTIDSSCIFSNTFIKPDGGFLYLIDKKDNKYPILITEMKNQGTNDIRQQEGKPKQAQGNAIERLGKNVICIQVMCLKESIFPFVCFGDGCDFAENSIILDRVITINQFGYLNKTYLYKEGPFTRGSFYFRDRKWNYDDMLPIMMDVAQKSVEYYLAKYETKSFK